MLKPAQIQASVPQDSVWVSASAGTGKTKVLIARLLRILLSGCSPEKILCITFTKTAAAEILERLQETTRQWSIMDTSKLAQELAELNQDHTSQDKIAYARGLFTRILNTPGGMRIMTIHAFCQSILSRFPLEAGTPTHFTVANDSKAADLLYSAKHHLLWDTSHDAQDFIRFTDFLEEDSQNTLLNNILGKRYYLTSLFQHFPTAESYRLYLHKFLNIDDTLTNEGLIQSFKDALPAAELRSILPVIATSTAKKAHSFADCLHAILENGLEDIAPYTDFYLTDKNAPRKHIVQGLKADQLDAISSVLTAEQQRVLDFITLQEALKIISATTSLYSVAKNILAIYQKLKRMQNILDYEDQISATRELLCDSEQYLWVLYKLDYRIEHLLIDEAQDTSPAQWDIVDALTDDFFSGSGQHGHDRTVFVVGDEKQSIFSFQNADPKGFATIGQKLAQKTDLKRIQLVDNFRSSPLILSLVDRIFSNPRLNYYITNSATTIEHRAFKSSLPGKIELWPLLAKDKEIPSSLQQYRLAQKIADYTKELLERPDITFGDIMILVNRRQPMAPKIMKAFKDRGIPISGPDRTLLKEHLAVKDCLSIIQYALNPEDNYNTACLLKSPFIGWDDDRLLALRLHNKELSLAQNLQHSNHEPIYTYLQHVCRLAKEQSLLGFLHAILDQPCPNDDTSGRHALIRHLGYDTDDILDSLLDSAYTFESTEASHLQRFHTWIVQQDQAIKKEQSDLDKSYVQLLTAHTSKGLQAKIVILADSTAKPIGYRTDENVLWMPEPEDGFLWPIDNKVPVAQVDALKSHLQEKSYAEYYRLLYVALTRAEQELIVCGHETKNTPHELYPSWYEVVAQNIEYLSNHSGYKKFSRTILNGESIGYSYAASHAETTDIQKTLAHQAFPSFLRQSPAAESSRTRPLRPSQPIYREPGVISPLSYVARHQHYQRGQLLHRLFRVLPDLPNYQQTLDTLLAQEVHLSSKDKTNLRKEVLAVLEHPQFQPLFSAQARAEVPLVGDIEINGKIYTISGQIDRLLVTPGGVFVVDYKTNRPPAQNENDVPEVYRMQMLAYKLLLEKIYPDRPVHTALLWTAVPYLMPLSL